MNFLKARPLSVEQYSCEDQLISKHTCSICGRARSSSYQKRHPLISEGNSDSGICSRCVSSACSTLLGRSSHGRAISEVHHYHHVCSCQTITQTLKDKSPAELSGTEIPLSQSQSFRSQGLASASRVYYPYSLPTVLKEQPPPPLCVWSKPIVSHSLA